MKKTKIVALMLAFCAFGSFGMLAACGDEEDSAAKKEEAAHNEFIDEIGGVSETYTGGVSTVAYETAETAAAAYVEEEVIGLSKTATIENTVSKGELTQSQVEALSLPEEDGAQIVSVEEYEVEYSEVESAYASVDTLNTTKKVTVYIIKYSNDEFKYYTPAPVTGETITQNYYNSVFDSDRYSNCTYTYSMVVDMSVSGGGMTVDMDMQVEQLIKYADGKIYMEQSSTYNYTASYMGETETENESDKIYAYIEEVVEDEETVIKCYVKTGDSTEWYEGNLYTIGFSSLEQLTPFYDQYLDYSYFTKTSYGFELSGENADLYLAQVLDGMDSMVSGMEVDIFAKYYVQEGALSGMRMDMSCDFTVQGTTCTETATGLATIKDYGTTVVTKPFTE